MESFPHFGNGKENNFSQCKNQFVEPVIKKC